MLILCNRCYYKCPDAGLQLRCKNLVMRDIRLLCWEEFELHEYEHDCIHISEFVDTVYCKRSTLRQGRLVKCATLYDWHNE